MKRKQAHPKRVFKRTTSPHGPPTQPKATMKSDVFIPPPHLAPTQTPTPPTTPTPPPPNGDFTFFFQRPQSRNVRDRKHRTNEMTRKSSYPPTHNPPTQHNPPPLQHTVLPVHDPSLLRPVFSWVQLNLSSQPWTSCPRPSSNWLLPIEANFISSRLSCFRT